MAKIYNPSVTRKFIRIGKSGQDIRGGSLAPENPFSEPDGDTAGVRRRLRLLLGEAALGADDDADGAGVRAALEHGAQGLRARALIAEEGQVCACRRTESVRKGQGCVDRGNHAPAALLRRRLRDLRVALGKARLFLERGALDAPFTLEGGDTGGAEFHRFLQDGLEFIAFGVRHKEPYQKRGFGALLALCENLRRHLVVADTGKAAVVDRAAVVADGDGIADREP